MNCGRRDAKRSHLLRLEPDSHGERPLTKNVGALHAADGAQFRLHNTRHVVGDLVLVKVRRRESQVHRRKLRIRRLQVNDRRLRLGRQVVAHLRHFGLDLGESRVGIVVKLQVYGDRADALSARRLHVINAVGAGNHSLQGSRNKSAHQVSISAYIHGRDLHHRNVAARILPHAQRADGLQARNQNHQIDANGENRPFDE